MAFNLLLVCPEYCAHDEPNFSGKELLPSCNIRLGGAMRAALNANRTFFITEFDRVVGHGNPLNPYRLEGML